MSSQPPAGPAAEPPPGELERVLELIRHLRRHCPWDARQTARSLVPHLLEEAHEVAEAIRRGAPPPALAEELGDLLLNVAYQVVIAEETGDFDAPAVAAALERKMVRRHPHVDWSDYPVPEGASAGSEAPTSGTHAPTSEAAVAAWERRKAAERAPGASSLDGLPAGLDPLSRAHRVQDRVAGVGFDWDDLEGPAAKIAEELEEARDAIARASGGDAEPAEVEEELGDLLFAVVNLARRAGVHPANALGMANAKFERRFREVERVLAARGVSAQDLPLAELDAVWEAVKRDERGA
ncbi:MAG TPA: nucleoside triphosphate pyrophosphohydrolase [Longimicrobiales bacterium]|nr:nucleoside triphosphate pyrophosphohydrolase [Longimicrobiales bacterium]